MSVASKLEVSKKIPFVDNEGQHFVFLRYRRNIEIARTVKVSRKTNKFA